MTIVQSLIAFTLAATVLTITPGPDSGLVLRTAIVDGWRPAMQASLGIVTGLVIWGAGVAVGLGALVATSETAFAILQWAGAIYLVWFGLLFLLHPRKNFTDADARRASAKKALWRGLSQNLLNPKIAVFYVSFLPQFVPADRPAATFTFLLAVLHTVLTLVWFATLVLATKPLAAWLHRPNILARIDRFTGCIFMASGAQLAFSKLPI